MADVAADAPGQPEARTWPRLLASLIAGRDLDTSDTAWVMDRVLSEDATPAQLAGFLVGLRAKGETAAEVAGLAEAMLARAQRVTVSGPAVDIVGTGGDQAHTVNISTMAAIVVAAAGVPVVKHGNRAATSKCGAADLLQEVGVAIALPAPGVEACVAEVGIGFCFAPVFHPAMRHTSGPRAELGVPTAMNLLGPLTNPAQPSAGLVGCADGRLAPVIAQIFASRGQSVLVVRGDDGLDELTTTMRSTVWVAGADGVRVAGVDPAALGIEPATREQLRGGDAAFNAAACHALLAGKHGPVRDAVLLNAAGALVAADGVAAHDGGTPDGAPDLTGPLRGALERAAAAVDSGAAADLLARWAAVSSRLAA
ncbi:anthranilate phosphoribosyltransferase [Pseudonocardia sulfidoxydans NBRC 16205]|uniref:Anthranilate phosphoribosyltransferase n=1 Tax=Pseudonocardia sulfidoxydans NBRC 16205 TaxID=1223511 RepID=A0A511DKW7_9PSEU|nr:anthranilate phosphoribosyltransferase [Pseudonocardia sulfidoxydans]GEL25469.1 anthranilate phosphoribosyltransferase [Pseudonocardia sulfidoxydans NBRC 16205]